LWVKVAADAGLRSDHNPLLHNVRFVVQFEKKWRRIRGPRWTLNQRVPGSSPGAPTNVLKRSPNSRDGCTNAIVLAHGFTVPQMVELMRAGLATATAERVVAGGRMMEVSRVRITGSGRRAIADG
jgi:hypothetical protein